MSADNQQERRECSVDEERVRRISEAYANFIFEECFVREVYDTPKGIARLNLLERP